MIPPIRTVSLFPLLAICWLLPLNSYSLDDTKLSKLHQRDLITNSENQICRLIKSSKKIDLNLRGAFIFRKTLLLLSRDWLVYEIPNANFEKSFGKMLFNVRSVPIEQKWPAFGTNKRFELIKNRTQLNIYSIDGKLSLIYIDLPREEGLIYIMNYQVPLLINGMKYSILNSERQESTITGLDGMYTVEWVDGQYSMLNWQMEFAPAGNIKRATSSVRLWLYYTVNRANPRIRDRITITRQRIEDYNDPYVGSQLQLIPIIDWNMPCGFVHNGYFHLFDKYRIFIFSSVMSRVNHSLFYIDTRLRTIDARKYFKCQPMRMMVNTYPPITTPDSRASFFTVDKSVVVPTGFALVLDDLFSTDTQAPIKYGSYIIAAVLLLVGCLLIAGVLCQVNKNNKNKKRNNKPPPPSANARLADPHHRASAGGTRGGGHAPSTGTTTAANNRTKYRTKPAVVVTAPTIAAAASSIGSGAVAASTEGKITATTKESVSVGQLGGVSSSILPKSKIALDNSSHL